jgi:SEC-C motif
MAYVPFGEKFPDIAEYETRAVTVPDNDCVPRGEYGLVDSYCDEADCDCRRVFLSVYSSEQRKPVAVIAFGWESEKFYKEWMGSSDPKIIKDLKGPVLNMASPQSKFASNWLKFITDVVLKDKQYVERLKRHYQMFRQKIEAEEHVEKTNRSIVASPKVGRNELCPCGSGKKYKKCCYVVLH